MADTLIENILAKEPHSPTATIVPDKHTIITSLPEIQGNHDSVIPSPLNPFGRWRQKFREPLSEFLGTCMLLCLACGCIAQYTLSLGQSGNIYVGRALALMMPIYISGGISGGHLNPSVTITLACFRGFPWRKVPIYIGSQLLGAFTGAAIVYGAYHESIVEFSKQNDPDVAASIFYTNALPYLSNGSAFLVELIGTAIMLLVVLGQSDEHNMPAGRNSPLVIGLVIVSIGVSFGWETGFSLNPAADLGGRCLAAMAGWGHNVFTIHHGYTWVPIVAPITGGLLGGFLYEFFIDSESNRALSHRWRAHHKL